MDEDSRLSNLSKLISRVLRLIASLWAIGLCAFLSFTLYRAAWYGFGTINGDYLVGIGLGSVMGIFTLLLASILTDSIMDPD